MFKKDLPLIIIISLPFLYLAYIWEELPEKSPIHWDIDGEVDRYGTKFEFVLVPLILPLLTYIVLKLIPKLDPKGSMINIGDKYNLIKNYLVIFMTIFSLYILYSSQNDSFSNPNFIFVLLGTLYVVFGNMFKTIKKNYIIGFRIPWTLKDENNWIQTHSFASNIWMIGGFLAVLSSLILDFKPNLIAFLLISLALILIPTIYSYNLSKRN